MRIPLLILGIALGVLAVGVAISALPERVEAAAKRRRLVSTVVLLVVAAAALGIASRVGGLGRPALVALLLVLLAVVLVSVLGGSALAFRRARNQENRGLVVAGVLFVGLGGFGLTAGISYFVLNSHPELAGVQLLCTFFAADIFIGLTLLANSPASRRLREEPDTGLHGSADPELGAADEHGNIHTMAPTMGPFVYSLALIVLLGGLVYRDKLFGPWGIAFGITVVVVATAIWYRDVSIDAHAAVAGAGHGDGHGAAALVLDEPVAAPTVANYFEQLRQALESGDANWAADAYAPDAVYYEPANPPHLGRESIRAYLNDVGKGHREVSWTVERMGVDGNIAIVQWTLAFTARSGAKVGGQTGMTVLEAGPAGITYHRDYL
jgi:hypothetical protein